MHARQGLEKGKVFLAAICPSAVVFFVSGCRTEVVTDGVKDPPWSLPSAVWVLTEVKGAFSVMNLNLTSVVGKCAEEYMPLGAASQLEHS